MSSQSLSLLRGKSVSHLGNASKLVNESFLVPIGEQAFSGCGPITNQAQNCHYGMQCGCRAALIAGQVSVPAHQRCPF